MNAKLTGKIALLAGYVAAVKDVGLEIPPEMIADIDALVSAADDFATGLTDEESDAVVLAQLNEMIDAINAEVAE